MRQTINIPPTPVVKENFRKFAEQMTGWEVKDTNIKKIRVHAFSDRIKRPINSDICVGKEIDTNLSNTPHEPVLAIFESNEYIVVTPSPRTQEATVYLFGAGEILNIERENQVNSVKD